MKNKRHRILDSKRTDVSRRRKSWGDRHLLVYEAAMLSKWTYEKESRGKQKEGTKGRKAVRHVNSPPRCTMRGRAAS